MNALIAGRCITGLGASGLLTSMITLMTQIIPLEERAGKMGLFGAVFGSEFITIRMRMAIDPPANLTIFYVDLQFLPLSGHC